MKAVDKSIIVHAWETVVAVISVRRIDIDRAAEQIIHKSV